MAERIAYVDAFSGASGDMLLGAMIHAGLDLDELREVVASLGLQGCELRAQRQVRRGISGIKFDVHDRESSRPARNLGAVRSILDGAPLSDEVRAGALGVFEAIARAEAEVHGTSPEEVHFHEIGAVDTLVDVVGFCWALERLGISTLYSSPLPLGSGTVQTEHGLLPVPAPATLGLLSARAVPTVPSEARAELVTPTGAALLAELACFEQPAIAVQHVGYGFGARELPWANMLRIWIGTPVDVAWAPGSARTGHTHHHHSHEPSVHDHGHDQHTHEHPESSGGHGHPLDHTHSD